MINIKSDSRKVLKGDIFVALKGIDGDGHDYIDKAIKNGASKIIAERGSYSIPYEIVSNSRDYLNNYLKNNYQSILNNMTIIGITGTNGKTTTAYLTYQALNKLNKKCCYIGTIGYYLDKKITSLPNTSPDICDIYDMLVNAYEKGYQYACLEVSSQGLSYDRFNGINFDYALFTNLTEDHLDYHKTMENYAQAKQKLFYNCQGINAINIDDSYCDYFKINNYVTYGQKDSDYQICNFHLTSHNTSFQIKIDNKAYLIKSSLLGEYNIYNITGTCILLKLLNIKIEDIQRIIPHLKTPDGRMDIVRYEDNTIIIDYAHTPDAMENLFKTVSAINNGSIYTVFGCTGDRDRLKRPIMMNLALKYSKYVIVTSDDLHTEDFNHIVSDMIADIKSKNYEICESRAKAIAKGLKLLTKHDILLILGKGHEDFIIVKNQKIPFNDKKEVNKLIKQFEEEKHL